MSMGENIKKLREDLGMSQEELASRMGYSHKSSIDEHRKILIMENESLNMERPEKAKYYFEKGYNCAQAMIYAFSDILPADKEILLKLSSSFGGGMGRLREVCGAVSAAFMIIGMLYGYDTPETGDIKKKHYERIQAIAEELQEKNGSIVCRELLGLNIKKSDPAPSERNAEYYKKRPCGDIVYSAAKIIDEYLKDNR